MLLCGELHLDGKLRFLLFFLVGRRELGRKVVEWKATHCVASGVIEVHREQQLIRLFRIDPGVYLSSVPFPHRRPATGPALLPDATFPDSRNPPLPARSSLTFSHSLSFPSRLNPSSLLDGSTPIGDAARALHHALLPLHATGVLRLPNLCRQRVN